MTADLQIPLCAGNGNSGNVGGAFGLGSVESCDFALSVQVAPGAPQTIADISVRGHTIDFSAMITELRPPDYAGLHALESEWVNWKGCNCRDNVSETLPLRRELESMASMTTKKG